jgi:integrase
LGSAALSGSHTPHLQRRNGIFHLRLRVPDELRQRVGLVEVRRSLQTYSQDRARLLAAIFVPRVREVFHMANVEFLSRDRTRALIVGCFDELRASVEIGFLPSSGQKDLEVQEQAQLAEECINELVTSIAKRTYSGSIKSSAARLCAADGWTFEALPEAQKQDLLEGVSRAVIEQQKIFIARLNDRLSIYAPSDPLFRGEINCTEPRLRPVSIIAAPLLGPNIQEALTAYLDRGRRIWTAKTHAGRVRHLRYLEEHFGSETAMAAISAGDVRSYRDALKKLRSNHHRTNASTFATKQTDNEKHWISPKTASLMFESVKAFFRWATEEEGYLGMNPAEKVRAEVQKKIKGAKSRRPFSPTELQTLFTQPVFTGCLSAKRRFQPGTARIDDDYFWIPILGFYTGARLGEIVQLHLADLHLESAIPFFEITEANSGQPGSPNAKHVKSAAGIRKVPLHPDLLDLGFKEFVIRRAKHRKSTERLFHRIAFGSDGQASTVFSKWFARFLDKAGLNDPALVFHSFRHNAEDAFRNANQQQYVIDRIIGHSDAATSAGYGEGIDLETAYAAVQAMNLKARLPSLWRDGDTA